MKSRASTRAVHKQEGAGRYAKIKNHDAALNFAWFAGNHGWGTVRSMSQLLPSPPDPISSSMNNGNSRYATSLTLLSGLKAGDDSGWHQFVHLYTPLIYGWCKKGGLQAADAADVCQEVFRSVSRGIEGLEYEDGHHRFRGWLWTITRRTLSKHYGREQKRPRADGGTDAYAQIAQVPDWIDDEQAPEAGTGDSEVIRRAAEVIKEDFAEHTWQAFWLCTVEELPAAEVAERLEMSPNGVRQAKFRVLSRLKEFVGFA